MERQENVEVKQAFIDHLDALRAYGKLANRYGQCLTEAEHADLELRLRKFLEIGRTFGLSDGALKGLIHCDSLIE
ncbi:MAG: hypothetical protein FI707_13620 [SAR202 cluster bacterium]|jgi:hypothetical protein|nr:hypothetical protein [Chloroflexota bacterium]MDP6421963.1 hypothetical protein [SAR202 cluster bacterium]HAL48728.1 hypothetical protein [Dehalococcoidia bacterium]MDP6664860.1 hypothetical protein [SAR202 cluster bacterium]MDP6801187.1 hypothetical protein [SAR202 cluster bacterium]|tara:strand:+ start:3837 stop:4061 length:225 start_codon:yes stop_codon:yes gene_type:complete